MAGTFGPQDVAEDGRTQVGSWVATGAVGYAGVFAGNDYNIGGRVTGVGVPDGATITSATVTVQVTATGGTSVDVRCYAEDTDDAAAIAARGPTQPGPAWTLTTAFETVAVNPGTGALAIPFTGPMQELIDRTGWTWTAGTGSPDVAFALLNQQASGTDYLQIELLEATGTNQMTLTVNYTVAGGSAVPAASHSYRQRRAS